MPGIGDFLAQTPATPPNGIGPFLAAPAPTPAVRPTSGPPIPGGTSGIATTEALPTIGDWVHALFSGEPGTISGTLKEWVGNPIFAGGGGGIAYKGGEAAAETVGRYAGQALGRIARGIGGFLEPAIQKAPATPAAAPAEATSAALVPATAPEAVMTVALSPAQQVVVALKAATPVRAAQEAAYSAERSRRLGAAMAIGGQVPGQAGFRQQLGALAGELPKPAFTPLQIDQPTVDALFNQVEASPLLSGFNKITAKTGLAKLFGAAGGQVPTEGELSLLGRVFGDDFVQTVQAKGAMMPRLLDMAGEVLSVPRALMASTSFVSPFRHGIFTAASYPRQFANAFGQQFRYFASEDAYQAMAQDVVARPSYDAMEQHGLALTGLANAADPTAREEQFVSTLAQRIPVIGPVVRASNRAYTGFLMKLRADLWDDLTAKAETAGVDQSPQFLDGLARFINTATGRGDLGMFERAGGMLSTALFAPRLLASRLNLLNPLYYASLPPFVQKEALRSAFSFAAMGMTFLGVMRAAGAQVGTDPSSADFGKARIGNTRIDIWGGFQQIIRPIGQLMTGQLTSTTTGRRMALGGPGGAPTGKDVVMRSLESKANPVVGFALDLLQGKDISGKPIQPLTEAGKLAVPLMVQNLYDLASQPDTAGLLGVPFAPFLGMQTYGPETPTSLSPTR